MKWLSWLLLVVGLVGCEETMTGVQKDLDKANRAVESGVEAAKKELSGPEPAGSGAPAGSGSSAPAPAPSAPAP
jgi:hypothetical protein